ncbi:PPE-FAMILY domain protein [Mycobacterium kansasii]|uniref:PPE-FAMILY domain protein n=1 Tax=Mycobacterium kansasii TaxID=1768 RepID=A0A1V3WT73_MYCKA|nr:PPE-FAMILY domain protein [Mycobacterium kansasii]
MTASAPPPPTLRRDNPPSRQHRQPTSARTGPPPRQSPAHFDRTHSTTPTARTHCDWPPPPTGEPWPREPSRTRSPRLWPEPTPPQPGPPPCSTIPSRAQPPPPLPSTPHLATPDPPTRGHRPERLRCRAQLSGEAVPGHGGLQHRRRARASKDPQRVDLGWHYGKIHDSRLFSGRRSMRLASAGSASQTPCGRPRQLEHLGRKRFYVTRHTTSGFR